MSKDKKSKHGKLYPWTVMIKGAWWLCMAPVKTIGSAAQYFNVPFSDVLPGWHFGKAYPDDFDDNDNIVGDTQGENWRR